MIWQFQTPRNETRRTPRSTHPKSEVRIKMGRCGHWALNRFTTPSQEGMSAIHDNIIMVKYKNIWRFYETSVSRPFITVLWGSFIVVMTVESLRNALGFTGLFIIYGIVRCWFRWGDANSIPSKKLTSKFEDSLSFCKNSKQRVSQNRHRRWNRTIFLRIRAGVSGFSILRLRRSWFRVPLFSTQKYVFVDVLQKSGSSLRMSVTIRYGSSKRPKASK